MSDVLDTDQEAAVKIAIGNLNRVSMRLSDGEQKESARDMIWDLTLLFSEQAREHDARPIEEVQTDLFDHGEEKLNGILEGLEGDSRVLAVEAKVLLGVVGLLNTEQEQTRWRDSVAKDDTPQTAHER